MTHSAKRNMTSATQDIGQTRVPLPGHASILLAVDASDHSNRAVEDTRAIASLWGSKVTAAHVYAARMHDVRFKQMEGGLPEQFREEQELERQRDVHDDLITRGLSIITDSYLDQAERLCAEQDIDFSRKSLEGKNYRGLVRETNSGEYDLLVIGALGVGAIAGSQVGSVCRRVLRRAEIDTLVIKDPRGNLKEGPIVVAVDGSSRSYGGLLSALALAKQWSVPVKVVAAFDPYFHYVAFNRIAGVLSEEAGRVFRFKEQEKLHEEIIDSGLAKIYRGHLDVAESIAMEYAVEVETALLDGKPYDAIQKYLDKIKPSLLVIGKLGIHADPELDIGGNAENLLHSTDCAILLSQRQHQPRLEVIADVTTSWTHEAERRMENVPDFVRNMARMAILRYAQERGHTVITERIVEQATAELMPAHAERSMAEIVEAHDARTTQRNAEGQALQWSAQARALLAEIHDASLRENIARRAEKKARVNQAVTVAAEHVRAFLNAEQYAGGESSNALHWQAAALARLARVPEGFMRDASKQRIEKYARGQGLGEVTLEAAEAALDEARQAMQTAIGRPDGGEPGSVSQSGKCPFASLTNTIAKGVADHLAGERGASVGAGHKWTDDALVRLQAVPEGYCREMTARAAETIAAQQELREIDAPFLGQLMEVFKNGADAVTEELPWDETARQRISRAPPVVRGMLVREIEGWARRHELQCVNADAVEAVKQAWMTGGVFHLDPNDPRSR